MKLIMFSLGFILSSPFVIFWLLYASIWLMFGSWRNNRDMIRHGYYLAYSIDQFVNTTWLGDPDETISSRTGRAIESGKALWWVPYFGKFVDFLAHRMFGEKNHIKKSLEKEEPNERELISWIKD